MMPVISVIVPVYNAEQYLEKCIESILNQSYLNYELILIDDGSVDRSGDICESFRKRDQRIRVLHQQNGGAVKARLKGALSACGAYFAFVDADDWLDVDFLEKMISWADQSNADIIAMGICKEFQSKTEYVYNRLPEGLYEGERLKYLYENMLYYDGQYKFGITQYLCNKLFKKEVIIPNMDIDPRIYDGEDVAILYPSLLTAERVYLGNDCSYHYVYHNGSVSSKKRMDFYENVSCLYLCLNDKFCKSPYYDVLLPQLNQYFRMMTSLLQPEKLICMTKYFFPFKAVEANAKIVLYGAGVVGQTYYQQIQLTDYCRVVLWCDKGFESMAENIVNPDKIRDCEYDFVVIAIDNKRIAEEVKNFLYEMNVGKDKIIWKIK